jgi:1-acyl-sn-glycerol-3-phosphate acyltransferase
MICIWLFVLITVRIFDRDPVLYKTGRMFRNLGLVLVKINPNWKVIVTGVHIEDPRLPYVVVANHQSLGDIPVVSHLPWEMKWVGKEELFKIPIVGWQMKLAGDIPVNRKGVRRWEHVAKKAGYYLDRKCSVMIFPEGTRTKDGNLQRFTDGAFALAIKHQVPILPVVVEGTFNCIPKHTWVFGPSNDMIVKVLDPIPTKGMDSKNMADLREKVHHLIESELEQLRQN